MSKKSLTIGKSPILTFFSFALTSAAGLLSDLFLYTVQISLGATPAVANLISSGLGFTIVYYLVTKHTFGVDMTWRAYTLFFGWYTCTILFYSTVVAVLTGSLGLTPIFAKALTVPASFVGNYIFNRFLFRKAKPAI